MKYLKLFENFDQSTIDDICEEYGIKNYTLNADGSIDVNGNVWLFCKDLTELPLKFNKVTGYFNCSANKLTNLEGAPNYVGTGFFCFNNNLTSLIGGPKEVVGKFYIKGNYLTNLIGGPKEVIGDFDCSDNKLTSLDGYPNYISGYFTRNENPIDTIIILFRGIKTYLEYQETYNFIRKDGKIIKHLFEEAIKDYNEYYDDCVEMPEKIEGYTYI